MNKKAKTIVTQHELRPEILEKGESPEVNRDISFFIGFTDKYCNPLETAFLLLKRLPKEREPWILKEILYRLAKLYKPKEFDLSPIYKLVKHNRWNARSSAYKALTNSEVDIEPFLIKKIKRPPAKVDICYIIEALMYVGSKNTIPFIEPHLKNKTDDIREAAQYAITVIMLRGNETEKEICLKTKLSSPEIKRLSKELTSLTRR